jgi:hypothetical protein
MNYYVYVTEQCEKEAQKYGFRTDLENLQEKLENDQTTIGLRRFPKPFLAKKLGRKGRLVITENFIDGDCVLCFFKLYDRGDTAYESVFLADPQQFYEDNMVPSSTLSLYLQDRKRTKPVPSYPSMTNLEREFLFSLDATTYQEDGFVLESQDWIEKINQRELQKHTSVYWEILADIIEQRTPPDKTFAIHKRFQDRAILFRYFPEYHKWFLVAPIDQSDTTYRDELIERYYSIFCDTPKIPEDVLIRMSRRSYPALVVYDDEIWIQKTQQSVDANLALSGEEVRVMDSILMGGSKLIYPLFINGRPGSGKSTLLQYLFAEHLHQYFKLNHRSDISMLPPIYLTYSEDLLTQAKESIRNILLCDSKKVLDDSGYLSLPETWQKFDQAFGYFRRYLLELVPENKRALFDNNKYVNFTKFKTLWHKQYSRSSDRDIRKLSPELAWHVIRTYIKGMRQDMNDFFDFESYRNELPKKQKTVTDSTFENVFVKIWEKWYENLNRIEGYWDDQDLARVLLDSDLDLSRHPAVFCDESQDFTKIELELILSLSIYVKRDVPSLSLSHIPFAFAGDPLQTLNPTGFDWSSTQASFHENIVMRLDKDGKANLNFNFQELTFNYRSIESIVRLCNLIQLIRGVAFDNKYLYPQKNWTLAPPGVPVYYEANEPTCQSFLREHQEVVIIIPCQEGEEQEYLQNDPILQKIALDSDNRIVRNVHSPIRVKGLEFSRVILYKFGQECLERYRMLLKRLDDPENVILDKEDSLPLEYFVNRLYVAASRAQNKLYIVDTQEGLDEFWKYAHLDEYRHLLDLYTSQMVWSVEDLISIHPGSREDWDSDKDRDDPRQLGEKYLKWGCNHRDIELLKIARRNFELVNDIEKSNLCLALVFEYQEEWEQAGKLYYELNYLAQAKECYWRGHDLPSILQLVRKDASIVETIEYQVAAFLSNEKFKRNCEQFLERVHTAIKEDPFLKSKMLVDQLWLSTLKALVEALDVMSWSDPSVQIDWSGVYSQLSYILGDGLAELEIPEIAHLAYLAGRYQEAVNIWEKLGISTEKTCPNWLMESLGRVKVYPENLHWLNRIGNSSRIYEEYLQHQDVRLTNDDNQTTIYDILLKRASIPKVLNFVRNYPTSSRYADLVERLLDSREYLELTRVQDSLLLYLVNAGEWEKAINFASNGEFPDSLESHKQISSFKWDLEQINISLIKRLANSERLATELNNDRQKLVSDYLMKHLRSGNISFRNKITLDEAGGAIERANVVVNALAFYEFVMRGGWTKNNAEERRFVRDRWVKCKYKQVSVTRDLGKQRQIEQEANAQAARWKVVETELPEYPIIVGLPHSSRDQDDLLTKLIDLRDAGIFSDEEFEQKRKELLSR